MKKYIILSFLIISCKYKKENVSISNKCSLENIEHNLLQLEEVKQKIKFIDSISNKTKGISFQIDSTIINNKNEYIFNVGYNSTFRFEKFYTFYISKEECSSVKIYDKKEDIVLNIEEWRGNNSLVESKAELKKIDLSFSEGTPCLKKGDLSLPYNQKTDINTIKYNIAKCNIKGVSDWLCADEKLRYIPLFQHKNTNAILIPMDCGDFPYRYYLLTVKNNSIISNLYVEGDWYETIINKENTSFEINKDYIIKVKTKNVNGDTGVNQIKNYRITEEGKIEEIR